MKRLLHSLIVLFLLGGGQVEAQLSQGGTPRVPLPLKSAVRPLLLMPEVSNERLQWQSLAEQEPHEEQGILKPLRFAHAFEVNYSPATHGLWMGSADGWKIWQLTIRSTGAYSLNLLFRDFRLPSRSRLFLYTPEQDQILGAYTSDNNPPDGIFALSPLPGDEITLQYECPPQETSTTPFVISAVNHDFLGILKYIDERRPMGVTAEACNLDIYCSGADRWREVQNSVCRIMIQGRDLCTGTLVNNTAGDHKPYILTANHCISTSQKAAGSLFLFNYESPYCGPLDGDVTHSLSGSTLRATLDSLDFTLVELTTPPPPAFRPYYAGWNREPRQTDTTASIHHPQGDIKKIALDHHSPMVSSFLSQFSRNSFWKVLRWDVGTTEIGSSGGPLFNRHQQVTGTLSGGAASCSNPVNDYYVRFDLAWAARPDSSRQLKCWLDPAQTGTLSLQGRQFNEGDNLCQAFTPLKEGDTHELLLLRGNDNLPGGYWTGTNNAGITEVANRFSIPGKESIRDVSLGIGKLKALNQNSSVAVRFYNLYRNTVSPVGSETRIPLKNLVSDAMNLVHLEQPIEPGDTFLVSLALEAIAAGDTLALYQSGRTSGQNSLFLLKNGTWRAFPDLYPAGTPAAPAMEIIACNVGIQDSIPSPQQDPVWVYPNPATSRIRVQTKEPLTPEMVSLFSVTGQQLPLRGINTAVNQVDLSLAGHSPGIYVVRVKTGTGFTRHKIVLTRP